MNLNNVDDLINPIIATEPTNNSSNNEKFARIDGGEQQVVVACRIRPLTEEEIMQGSTIISHKIEDNMIVLMDPMEDPDDILRANRSRERQFVFDMVFDAKSTQQVVYEKTTKILLNGVLNGYNATVFAYGATGAGKTYTMLGTQEEPGIMFRTLHDLFIEISKTSDDLLYQVSMSYLEIYNELIRDLLNPSTGFLELREDAKGGVQIAGISEKVAETPQEVMYMLHKGNKERTQEPTKANKTSSRSHAVLQVNIKQRNKVRKHTQEIRLGKLYMIDLAGSERAAQTQNTGKRMVEGAHINRSLLALGNCINALSEKGNTKYVNYRDSKLTRILKDSLGGNSKTVMIAHISPSSIHFEESRNTLNYADRAKYIRTKLRRNVIDVSYHISQYQQIIQELAQEIANLKDQRTDLESRVSNLYTKGNIMQNEDKLRLEEALKLRELLVQSFKDQVKLRKDLLEINNAIMGINIESDRHNRIIEKWKSNSNTNGNNEGNTNLYLNAKEELKVVEHDKDELETKRTQTLKEYEQLQVKTKKLRDTAAKKLSTKEQKEILTLLCKNFEFEMKSLELEAEIFKRDFKLREQDMVMLRMDQHRSLCDTLITHQKRLIEENNIIIPHDLSELYQLYSRDTREGQLMKDISALSIRPYALASPKPAPSTSTFLTQIQEEDPFDKITPTNESKLADPPSLFPTPWSKRNFTNAVDRNDNENKVFYRTNKAPVIYAHKKKEIAKKDAFNTDSNVEYGNKNASISHFAFNNPGKENRNISLLSMSTNDSNAEIIFEKTNNNNRNNNIINNNNNATVVTPGEVVPANSQSNKTVKRHTQGIAAVAAQRKATQHHRELMEELAKVDGNPKIDNTLTTSRLAKHDQTVTNSNNNNSNNNNNNNNSSFRSDYVLNEKRNSILTDGSNKTKKQVKIKDLVEFKLSDENDKSDFKNFKIKRRGNSDSPNPTSKLTDDENANTSFNRFPNDNDNSLTTQNKTKKKSKKSTKRSKSNNPVLAPIITNNQAINFKINNDTNNSNSSNNNNVNSNVLNNNNNNNTNTNSESPSKQAPKVIPSIPNYSKDTTISISGTSVLKL